MSLLVRRAATPRSGVAGAEEMLERLDPGAAFAVVYATPGPEADALARRMHDAYAGRVFGCLASGVIGPGGYHRQGATAATFSSPAFEVTVEQIELGTFDDIDREVTALAARVDAISGPSLDGRSVGVLLVDGMSLAEEALAAQLQLGLPWLEVVGGSASGQIDGGTGVLVDGAFRAGVATLAVLRTTLPLAVVKVQHHVVGELRLVVTDADPNRRRVHTLDGHPAAFAYARAIGCDVDELDETVFARHPLVLRLGGVDFLRSVKEVRPDGSLDLFCQLATGAVLRIGAAEDPLAHLSETLASYGSGVGSAPSLLAFDCLLRRLEFERDDVDGRVGALLDGFDTVGFSTFGEQFQGLHMNQTLTGLMIGNAA